MLESIPFFLILFAIIGAIVTIPFWMLSILEKVFEKKLYVIHIFINAFFILIPIYNTINNYLYPTPSRMVHGPTPEILFALILVAAFPALLLFYSLGITILKHYFLESYKYIRFTFIVIYSIYTIIILSAIIWNSIQLSNV